jgi:hypothetical protein
MPEKNALSTFDPRKLAHFEKENYVAYYQKDWLKLLRVSVGMVGQAYGLSWWQAIYAAYLVARAEVAFAPFPNNDVPVALAYMRRFFRFINRVHGLSLPVDEAASRELDWWIAHRHLFANPENEGLVEAVAKSYAVQYGRETEKLREAAYHRSLGMLYSDQWVNGGKQPGSPLLAQEEEELYLGYAALKEQLQAGMQEQPGQELQQAEA